MTLTNVAIYAGHPSHPGDTGATSPCGRIVEPRYTIRIGRQLLAALQAEPGVTPVMLRTGDDEVVAVSERARRATAAGAHLVVSIHVDSWDDTSWHGASVIHWPGNQLGATVADEIASSWPAVLRRVTHGYPALEKDWPRARNVLRGYPQTAVLAECGYASHSRDVDALVQEAVQAQIVGALVQGVRYFCQRHEARGPGDVV